MKCLRSPVAAVCLRKTQAHSEGAQLGLALPLKLSLGLQFHLWAAGGAMRA